MHVEARPRILLVDRSIGAHPIDQDIPSRVATGYGVDSALLDLLWAPKSSCQFWSREHGPCCALVENKPKGTPSTDGFPLFVCLFVPSFRNSICVFDLPIWTCNKMLSNDHNCVSV